MEIMTFTVKYLIVSPMCGEAQNNRTSNILSPYLHLELKHINFDMD